MNLNEDAWRREVADIAKRHGFHTYAQQKQLEKEVLAVVEKQRFAAQLGIAGLQNARRSLEPWIGHPLPRHLAGELFDYLDKMIDHIRKAFYGS